MRITEQDFATRVKAYEQALLNGKSPKPSDYALNYATAQIARVRIGVEKSVTA